MKELSIEEKAKAYDEVHEKIAIRFGSNVADEIFSQFEMSEDERIRKWLVEEIYKSVNSSINKGFDIDMGGKALAWLEKQGEKKPVELQQDMLSQEQYSKAVDECIYGEKPVEWKQENVEELTDFENAMMHIGNSFFSANAGLDPNDTETVRSQADLLLELAQTPVEWSKEDEKYFNILISLANNPSSDGIFDYHQINKSAFNNWAKSLNDRVQPQPKQEWSEEDEERIEQICSDLKCGMINFYANEVVKGLHYKEIIESNIDWLKSLRPQNRWKPSEEQMQVLQWCMPLWSEPKTKAVLESLIADLKKLKS